MALKRLTREYQQILKEKDNPYVAYPLEDNMFEWHFTIKGPEEMGFKNGLYHGKLRFPLDYPMKPPDILLLTPNGRFELNKKICLSITGHHPEYWRPAWGVGSALVALISFMTTKSEGAIGGIDWSEEERQKVAIQSRDWYCNVCGKANKDMFTTDESNETISKSSISNNDTNTQIPANQKNNENIPKEIPQSITTTKHSTSTVLRNRNNQSSSSIQQKPSSSSSSTTTTTVQPERQGRSILDYALMVILSLIGLILLKRMIL